MNLKSRLSFALTIICAPLPALFCLPLVVGQDAANSTRDDENVEDAENLDDEPEPEFNINNRWLRLLRDKSVQKELDLTESQSNELKEAIAWLGDQVAQVTSAQKKARREGDADLSDEDRGNERREERKQIEAKFEEFQKKIDGIIVPSQQKRLQQILFRLRLRSEQNRYQSVFLSEPMIAELEIDKKQQLEISKLAEKAKRELDELIAKHNQETREKILALLKKEQRDKIEDLMGAEFKFD